MTYNSVINVEHLGKCFRIAHQASGRQVRQLDTLSERVQQFITSPSKWFQKDHKSDFTEDYWALRDVTFKVNEGEALGIIGRNGAGKSTLLKILSRITEPSRGTVRIRGRVASLLEVGSGMHPELTGRENIYLNGSILGMSRAEICGRFDEIVDFSGVTKFLDTPVKRYSSGMYVRLAFAVAAHLEPEILIVDEVLAVGDLEFQRKCLGKMEGVARGGRTVIFVSHSMAAIRNLTRTCLLLDRGGLVYSGETEEAISRYLHNNSGRDGGNQDIGTYRASWCRPLISALSLLSMKGEACGAIPLGGGFGVEMKFSSETPLRSPNMGIVVQHPFHGVLANINMRITGFVPEGGLWTVGTFRGFIPELPLVQGIYTIDVWLADENVDLDCVSGYLRLEVEEHDVFASGKAPASNYGVLLLKPRWEVSR
ncbi:MAG: polysaccharide ABC transporter ATP-binding protein [Prosthecobacter sp.]